MSGEVQIVSTMLGLFWEVEHSAIYKPVPKFKKIAESQKMKDLSSVFCRAVDAFEQGFEAVIGSAESDE